MKDMWDKRYSEEVYAYGKEPNEFLVQYLSFIPQGGHVLCLAEGEGRNALYLAEKGYQVTAVDFSAVGMQKAQLRAQQRGLTLQTIVEDLTTFDMGHAKWDGIISIFAHLPSELRKQIHQNVQHALKPGGFLLLEAYRPEQLDYRTGGPAQRDFLVNLEILHRELPLLVIDYEKELIRDIHEGKFHHGESAVVQLVGHK
jgi:SAM-dependent methyltransferase